MNPPKPKPAPTPPKQAAASPAQPLRRRDDDDFPEPPEPPEPPPPRPPHDPPAQPPTGPAPPRGETPASITSWTRLEPVSRDAELRSTLGARVFDPLWMLTRQWQFGEFQAEDAGSPVRARVLATSAAFSRCHLGELPPNTRRRGAAFDGEHMPLETLVERRRTKPPTAPDDRQLTLVVDAGLDFLRRLELALQAPAVARKYRAAFIARFVLQGPAETSVPTAQTGDDATARFLQTMVGRALDARRLAAALHEFGAAALARDPALMIAVRDRAEVEQSASRWLTEHDALFSEPAGAQEDAWLPERLEYAVSIAARLSDRPEDEVTLTAGEFDDGRLDWTRFDVNAEVNLGTDGDGRIRQLDETTVPAPVTFRGAPAARFWELEDARLDYGLMPVGPTDLAQLMMIEYAGSYGNDWFVVPLTLPVGSVTRVDSLVVTDSFGMRSLLRPIGDRALPAPHWSMWQMAHRRRAGEAPIGQPVRNLFVLPPTLGPVLDGAPLEDLLFMRDELANMAWAIERSIEGGTESALPRHEAAPPASTAVANAATASTADVGIEGPSEVPREDAGPPRYRLASTVPPHWIPLLPVQLRDTDDKVISRLRRGAVLQVDGPPRIHRAAGDILNASPEGLLHDEEVPREGVHVTRLRRLARWIDGSTWLWTAHRTHIGRGEGSSGLVFDRADEGSAGPG